MPYLLSLVVGGARPSIRATVGSDEVRPDGRLASGVPDSPSDAPLLRPLCDTIFWVFVEVLVRLRIC